MGYGTILQLPCPRWIAFAAASVLPPFAADAKQNLIHRVPGNMVGCLIFALFISFAPTTLFPYIGLMAGFAGNLVTKYIYKTAVNTIAAVSTVYVLMGMSTTLLARISLNIIGVVLAISIRATWDLVHRLRSRRTITITADAV